MIGFLLPLLTAAYTPHNSACSYIDPACAADAACGAIDAKTSTCVTQAMTAATGAPWTFSGIPSGLGANAGALLYTFALCNMQATTNVTAGSATPLKMIYPTLANYYECDALASGYNLWTAIKNVFDSLTLCMVDGNCPANYDKLRSDAEKLDGGASFIYDSQLDWYMLDTTASDQQVCNIAWSMGETGDAQLNTWLSGSVAGLALYGRDPDALSKKCYDDLISQINKKVMTLLAISISASLVVGGAMIGGGCFWWYNPSCSCNKKDAYKADNPA